MVNHTHGCHNSKNLFRMDIVTLVLLSVPRGPANSHMAKHLESPNSIQEKFLSVGDFLLEIL